MNTDKQRWVPLEAAAGRLGITPEALREACTKRLTCHGGELTKGAYYVWDRTIEILKASP